MHPRFTLPLILCLLATGGCSTYQRQSVRAAMDQPYAAADPHFLERTGEMLGAVTLPGNQVREYVNGHYFFPVMLDAIRSAEHSITLASYIYWRGEAGRQFSEALTERARAGVKVRVSLDWLGSRCLDRKELASLRAAGAQVEFYNAFSLLHPFRMNHRDHRKLMVVDGRIGFIGGAGIDDRWLGNSHSPKHWRDTFYKVEGPVVGEMQAGFMDSWTRVAGHREDGPDFFPELSPVGDASAHVFSNYAGDGTDRVRLFYLLAFNSAQESIRIAMAYFIPCRATRDALIAARERGVVVEILVPNSGINNKLVRHMQRRHYGVLLRAGVRIHEFQPSMMHAKCIVVDDALVSIGSANMDERTFLYNDEANLNVLSTRFAERQLDVWEADKKRAHEVNYLLWNQRSPFSRLAELLLAPLEPLF